MANLFLCHDDEGNAFFMTEEEYFEHSKGPWEKHKYLYIDGNGNYVYPGDNGKAEKTGNRRITATETHNRTKTKWDGDRSTTESKTTVTPLNDIFLTRKNYDYTWDLAEAGEDYGDSDRENRYYMYDENGNAVRVSGAKVNANALKNRAEWVFNDTVSNVKTKAKKIYNAGKSYLSNPNTAIAKLLNSKMYGPSTPASVKKENKNPTGNSYLTKAKLAIKNYNLAKNRDYSSYKKADSQPIKRYKK